MTIFKVGFKNQVAHSYGFLLLKDVIYNIKC